MFHAIDMTLKPMLFETSQALAEKDEQEMLP
jgi:hypothetical protein